MYSTDDDFDENEKFDETFQPIRLVSKNKLIRIKKKTQCCTKLLWERLVVVAKKVDEVPDQLDNDRVTIDGRCHEIRDRARAIETLIRGCAVIKKHITFVGSDQINSFLYSKAYTTTYKSVPLAEWRLEEKVDKHLLDNISGLSFLEQFFNEIKKAATESGVVRTPDVINFYDDDENNNVVKPRSRRSGQTVEVKSKSSSGQTLDVKSGQNSEVKSKERSATISSDSIIDLHNQSISTGIDTLPSPSLLISPMADHLKQEDRSPSTHRLLVASGSSSNDLTGEEKDEEVVVPPEEGAGMIVETTISKEEEVVPPEEGTGMIIETSVSKEEIWNLELEEEIVRIPVLVSQVEQLPEESREALRTFIEPLVDPKRVKFPTDYNNEQMSEIKSTFYGSKIFLGCNLADQVMGRWIQYLCNFFEDSLTREAALESVTHTFISILFHNSPDYLEKLLEDVVDTLNTVGEFFVTNY